MASNVSRPTQKPALVRVTRVLFFLSALIWLVFGVISLIRLTNSQAAETIKLTLAALLIFANAGAMLGAGVDIATPQRRLYHFAFAVLFVNTIMNYDIVAILVVQTVLKVSDEFGMFDLVTLVINVVLMGLLIKIRPGETSTG
jgi:hypothetical protein